MGSTGSGFARRLDYLRRQFSDGGRERGSISPRPQECTQAEPERAISLALSQRQDATTRAAQGLAFLCEAAKAIHGHLFLFQRSGGISLAASTSTDAPPTGLEEYLRGRLELEFGAPDTEDTIQTVTLDIDAAALLSPFTIEHEHALVRTYFPIWIRANLGGHSSVVGAAAMGYEGEDAVTPEVQSVANAFGDYLVRSGDTALTEYGAVLSAHAG